AGGGWGTAAGPVVWAAPKLCALFFSRAGRSPPPRPPARGRRASPRRSSTRCLTPASTRRRVHSKLGSSQLFWTTRPSSASPLPCRAPPAPPRKRRSLRERGLRGRRMTENSPEAGEAVKTVVHVMRHGEVYNPQKILYGRLPDYHLSERGRAQAQAVADWLALRDIVYVVASPLERAQETAEPIAARLGLPVDTDEDLIESTNI